MIAHFCPMRRVLSNSHGNFLTLKCDPRNMACTRRLSWKNVRDGEYGHLMGNYRLHFRLRTLLLLTAPLCAALAVLAYHLTWLRERHSALRRQSVRACAQYDNRSDLLPVGLRLLGETAYEAFSIDGNQSELDSMTRLFPEAEISLAKTSRQIAADKNCQ